MTKLSSITINHLELTCTLCGHSGEIAVKALIEVLGRDMDVWDVVKRARCSRCHVKGQNTFRILYIGASRDAMLGAAVQ